MTGVAELKAGGELDCLVLEKVFGYTVQRIIPEWYGREVSLFFHPAYPNEVAYSWDEHSSNAIMYRNGKDSSDGVAQSVPFYSTEMNDAWEVHRHMCDQPFSVRQRYLSAIQQQTRNVNEGYTVAWPDVLVVLRDRFPEVICIAALQAIGPRSTEGDTRE